ncbi:MAG: bifunctional homocysteine S-methyltransferase/methylenetetrahydrofolate reductase [Planctomycetales bacterium]|nr:bifunctional homocysteine S-methyltransferase/methylenetetrahydrofolate reductase [Planctomycetales bacterium]
MARGAEFLERLRRGILVGDGAMGTLLHERGFPFTVCFEELSLAHPEAVRAVHLDYVAAGAHVIETNSFGANRDRLARRGSSAAPRDVNLAAARLAREAAGTGVFVAGAMGPLTPPRPGESPLPDAQREEIFREQAQALAEGGADLLILETFSDLDEALLALRTARGTGLPVVAQMAFFEGGRTLRGAEAVHALETLSRAGASVVGANCGKGPRETLLVLRELGAALPGPLSAYPNAGLPRLVGGRYVYDTTPEYLAASAVELVRAGASLVGGCCGTTPRDVRAIAEAVRGLAPGTRRAAAVARTEDVTNVAPVRERPEPTVFDGRGPVVVADLVPPRGLDTARVLEGARLLSSAGVQLARIPDNPLGAPRVSPLAIAAILRRESGPEPLVHVTGRDRNHLAIESELLGLHALAVRYLFVTTGDPPGAGAMAPATLVYDLTAAGIVEMAGAMNRGLSPASVPLGARGRFVVGVGLDPLAEPLDGTLRRLGRKIAAGAKFVLTQPIFEPERVAPFAAATASLGVPVLPGVLPLVSARHAEFLHNEVPGIHVPEAVRKRMAAADPDHAADEGLAIASDVAAEVLRRFPGIYVPTPFGNYALVAQLLESVRARR